VALGILGIIFHENESDRNARSIKGVNGKAIIVEKRRS
jgi:hypothetical protein